MKIKNRKRGALLAAIIAPLISVSSMVGAGSSVQGGKYQRNGVQIHRSSSVIEKPNKQIIDNNDTQHVLDIYLDLHKRWKPGYPNISRSDS